MCDHYGKTTTATEREVKLIENTVSTRQGARQPTAGAASGRSTEGTTERTSPSRAEAVHGGHRKDPGGTAA